MVSFRISPAIKKVYSDPFAQPIVFRGIFVEMGKKADRDQIVTLSYDGEFSSSFGHAVVAGSAYAEDRIREHLTTETSGGVPTLAQALTAAVYAWGVGAKHLDAEDRADADYSTDGEGKKDVSTFIQERLAKGWILEAGVLERNTTRESKFRLLGDGELTEALAAYRTS